MGRISAIEANNVVVLVFNPYPSQESPVAGVLFGLNVDDQAAHFSKELPANELEFVVLLLEILIQHDHLGETQRQKLHRVNIGELAQNPLLEARFSLEQAILRAIAHVEPSQEVPIADRRSLGFAVGLEVLNIGLGQWVHAPQLRHK